MRKIKFRGKSYETGEWIIGNITLCYDEKYALIEPDLEDKQEVDWETVGQYTGLKDKNGKEICEGDILKRTVHLYMYGEGSLGDCDDIYEVKYRDDHAGFYVGESPLFAEVNATFDFCTKCTQFEVVGNVHDNPELLETKE